MMIICFDEKIHKGYSWILLFFLLLRIFLIRIHKSLEIKLGFEMKLDSSVELKKKFLSIELRILPISERFMKDRIILPRRSLCLGKWGGNSWSPTGIASHLISYRSVDRLIIQIKVCIAGLVHRKFHWALT